MSQKKPHYLTVRPYTDDDYSLSGRWLYIKHPKYSLKPDNYIRVYLLLVKDFIEILNYIEPSDTNLKTFSFRVHELLLRVCVEVEANFKAILKINGYNKPEYKINIKDFYLVNQTHRLSEYVTKIPIWSGIMTNAIRQPFRAWREPVDVNKPWTLEWYDAYNASKHDRVNSMERANFENLLDAISGLTVLISAQYMFESFSPGPDPILASNGMKDGFDNAIGDFLRVSFPTQMEDELKYDFDWKEIQSQDDPFEKLNFNKLANELEIRIKGL